MRIRTYLILSYLAIILLITIGMMTVTVLTIQQVAETSLIASQQAIVGLTDANFRLSEKVLTSYGEKIVEAKAAEVANQVSFMVGGRDSYDYAQLRKNDKLRKIATQDILTSDGVAGYITLGDRTGVSVLHPNPSVEGKNFKEWAGRFPDLWTLVERSFTAPKVTGYYTFLERGENRGRKKYMVLVQAPQTPFTVAATVYIDQYFAPVQAEIREAREKVLSEAKQAIEDASLSTRSRVETMGLVGGLVLLALGAVFGLWFASSLSRPVIRLRNGVDRIGTGDFSAKVDVEGATEVRHLAKSFNQLGSQLTEYVGKRDFVRDTFGRYLTQEVVNRLLESKDGLELGGETREISMIMSDLRGFTAMTANMNPQQTMAFLNRYLGKMVEILMEYRGTIDEIIGDGILAFFGAPEPMEDHPARAVACALQMQAAMDEINAKNAADGFPRLEMGVAVNTGAVVVGNIGSEQRAKYGAVGSQVNYTGRAESFTVGGQVLITQSTYERLSEILDVSNVLEVDMKGVPEKVRLYDIIGIGGDYSIHTRERDEALEPLAKGIQVKVFLLEQKVVTEAGIEARITHAGHHSAKMSIATKLNPWVDVRMILLTEEKEPRDAELYAKVASVSAVREGFETVVRFTSINPQADRIIREAIQGP